jgi:hypothetical protein
MDNVSTQDKRNTDRHTTREEKKRIQVSSKLDSKTMQERYKTKDKNVHKHKRTNTCTTQRERERGQPSRREGGSLARGGRGESDITR